MSLSLTKLENIVMTTIKPSNDISYMTSVTNTSGWLHSEFVRLSFLHDHRETDRFFSVSGVS
jgi:hypothetical protein